MDRKVVIITGASGGIGKAAAYRLAKDGYQITLAARRMELLEQIAEDINNKGGRAIAQEADVSNLPSIQEVMRATVDHWGKIDVLLNNAGVEVDQPFHQMDPDLIQKEISINLIGMIETAQLALQVMIRQGNGHIINVASLAGFVAIPRSTIYSTTKFGVVGFSDGLRRYCRPYGIAVTTFCPGYVATDLTPGLSSVSRGEPSARKYRGLMQPGFIADKLAQVIQKPRRRVILPASWSFLIYAAQLFPGLTDRLIHHFE